MDPKFIRTTALIVVIFAAGLIAGQLTMSAHVKAEAEARLLTRIEGMVRPNESLRQLEQLAGTGLCRRNDR